MNGFQCEAHMNIIEEIEDVRTKVLSILKHMQNNINGYSWRGKKEANATK